jgi:hypothetical protein
MRAQFPPFQPLIDKTHKQTSPSPHPLRCPLRIRLCRIPPLPYLTKDLRYYITEDAIQERGVYQGWTEGGREGAEDGKLCRHNAEFPGQGVEFERMAGVQITALEPTGFCE